MRVVLTRHAERQLDKLHRDIAERSGEIGPTATSAASSRLSWLGAFPPDLLAGLRTLGFERRATIAFVVEANVVVIEGIFYGGQDVDARFRK